MEREKYPKHADDAAPLTGRETALVATMGLLLIALVAWLLGGLWPGYGRERGGSEILSVERVVPADASLVYEIRGRAVQTLPLRPGTYRVTVERLR